MKKMPDEIVTTFMNIESEYRRAKNNNVPVDQEKIEEYISILRNNYEYIKEYGYVNKTQAIHPQSKTPAHTNTSKTANEPAQTNTSTNEPVLINMSNWELDCKKKINEYTNWILRELVRNNGLSSENSSNINAFIKELIKCMMMNHFVKNYTTTQSSIDRSFLAYKLTDENSNNILEDIYNRFDKLADDIIKIKSDNPLSIKFSTIHLKENLIVTAMNLSNKCIEDWNNDIRGTIEHTVNQYNKNKTIQENKIEKELFNSLLKSGKQSHYAELASSIQNILDNFNESNHVDDNYER